MSEQSTPKAPEGANTIEGEQAAPTTPTDGIAALIAHEEARNARRVESQLLAEAAAEVAVDEALKATADAERAEYLKATAPTREATGYEGRHQAYDRLRLAFIEGTAADSSAEALKAAKALPGYKGARSSDIEARPI